MDVSSAIWRKSSRSSGGGNGDCVEFAVIGGMVVLRDSKHPNGPVLIFTQGEWRAFIESAKAGECDL